MLKKHQVFQELRNDGNVNHYGLAYKIVMEKLNKRKPIEIMDGRIMRNIVDTLFPTHELTNERRHNTLNTEFLSISTESSGIRT